MIKGLEHFSKMKWGKAERAGTVQPIEKSERSS